MGVGFQGAEYLRQDRAFQFIHDLDALSQLVKMVSSPSMGLLIDIWDVYAGGGSLDSVRNIPAESIIAVQVADMPADVAPADLDKNSRLLPGGENGRIDVAGFLAMLREWGYDGPVALKPSKGAFDSRRRDMIVKQAGESLDAVLRPSKTPAAAKPELAVAGE